MGSTPFPFALLFLFSFFRLIGPRYNCGLSWRFWSYHAVRRFIYTLYPVGVFLTADMSLMNVILQLFPSVDQVS